MNDRLLAFVTTVVAVGIFGSLVRDQPTPLPPNERDVQLVIRTPFKAHGAALGFGAAGHGASCSGVYPPPKKLVVRRGCAGRLYARGNGRGAIGRGYKKETTPPQEVFLQPALFKEEKAEFVPAMFAIEEQLKPCPADDMRSVCIARRAKMTKVVRKNQRKLAACYEDHLVKPTTVVAKVSTYSNGQQTVRLKSQVGDQNCWKRIAKDWEIPSFETETHANVAIHLRVL